jgi:hypothetical protein
MHLHTNLPMPYRTLILSQCHFLMNSSSIQFDVLKKATVLKKRALYH